MGMNNAGNPNQAVSGINVTPLVDVLLVLLIIFMVIVPVTPHGLEALVPQPPKNSAPNSETDTIVVRVLGTSEMPLYKINDQSLEKGSLQPKLAEIFSTRQNKQMFVLGAPAVDYAKIAEVIDFGHQAGVESIGLLTPQLTAGQ